MVLIRPRSFWGYGVPVPYPTSYLKYPRSPFPPYHLHSQPNELPAKILMTMRTPFPPPLLSNKLKATPGPFLSIRGPPRRGGLIDIGEGGPVTVKKKGRGVHRGAFTDFPKGVGSGTMARLDLEGGSVHHLHLDRTREVGVEGGAYNYPFRSYNVYNDGGPG